jgi:hypothetical protein
MTDIMSYLLFAVLSYLAQSVLCRAVAWITIYKSVWWSSTGQATLATITITESWKINLSYLAVINYTWTNYGCFVKNNWKTVYESKSQWSYPENVTIDVVKNDVITLSVQGNWSSSTDYSNGMKNILVVYLWKKKIGRLFMPETLNEVWSITSFITFWKTEKLFAWKYGIVFGGDTLSDEFKICCWNWDFFWDYTSPLIDLTVPTYNTLEAFLLDLI